MQMILNHADQISSYNKGQFKKVHMYDMCYYNVEWNPRQSWMKIPRMRRTHKNKKHNREAKRK